MDGFTDSSTISGTIHGCDQRWFNDLQDIPWMCLEVVERPLEMVKRRKNITME